MYVIIAGAGKVGWNLARELIAKDREVTLIESDHRRYRIVEEELALGATVRAAPLGEREGDERVGANGGAPIGEHGADTRGDGGLAALARDRSAARDAAGSVRRDALHVGERAERGELHRLASFEASGDLPQHQLHQRSGFRARQADLLVDRLTQISPRNGFSRHLSPSPGDHIPLNFQRY